MRGGLSRRYARAAAAKRREDELSSQLATWPACAAPRRTCRSARWSSLSACRSDCFLASGEHDYVVRLLSKVLHGAEGAGGEQAVQEVAGQPGGHGARAAGRQGRAGDRAERGQGALFPSACMHACMPRALMGTKWDAWRAGARGRPDRVPGARRHAAAVARRRARQAPPPRLRRRRQRVRAL